MYNYLYNQGRLAEDDTTNIISIIEAGRCQCVDEMEIEVNKQTFLGLKLNANPPHGVDILIPHIEAQAGVGGAGKYRIKIKYHYLQTV
jgi:hypothetical protein